MPSQLKIKIPFYLFRSPCSVSFPTPCFIIIFPCHDSSVLEVELLSAKKSEECPERGAFVVSGMMPPTPSSVTVL